MRRLILGLAIVLLFTSQAFAGRMYTQYIVASDTSTTTLLPTTATSVYTHSFPIKSGEYFSLGYKATSVGGTPNVNIQLQQSTTKPGTEGATDTDWVVPDNVGNIATGVTTETQHWIALSPVPLPYARFLVNEIGSSTETQVTLILTVVE